MKTYYGVAASNGTVKGKILNYTNNCGIPEVRQISDAESEKSRFRLAKFIAEGELSKLYKKALAELGEGTAMIFDIHKIMLRDDTYTDMICSIIDDRKITAERAVYETALTLSKIFDGLNDGYMRERRADVWDISRRVIAILKSDSRSYPKLSEPSIILAEDLSPSELLLPKKGKIIGILLTKGSITSHTAILANKMNIPLLVNIELNGDIISNGAVAVIDCENNSVSTEE